MMKRLLFAISALALNGCAALAQIPGFIHPKAYPPAITFGHNQCFTDSDCQFGNPWSQYPLGSVSTSPIIIGKAGSSIGSSTPGQTFTVRFASSGLTGSPIDITYTAIGGDTTATIATGLCTAVNANTTLHSASTGLPVFCQSSAGSATFNLQYSQAFSATGATPLTTTSTGTGTITLVSEVNQLDAIIMQLGRNAITAAGSALYALDFTGQSSAGFDTHYAIIGVSAQAATSGAQQGRITISVANNGSVADGAFYIERGLVGYTSSGTVASSGDIGFGSINLPAGTTSGYFLDGTNSITRNAGATQFIIASTSDNIVISTSGSGGVGINVTPTGGALTSGLGFFVSGTQVPTTGSGISLAGGATPVLTARNYGTATALALGISATSLNPATDDGSALGTTSLKWSDLFLASGAVINFNNGDVTILHAADLLSFLGSANGYSFSARLIPALNDGGGLGAATLAWSDLFLANGAVINFDNGDVLITHSANTLAFTGASSGYSFDVPIGVASGGTGIASGTSGGIPYFSGATTIASSAALAANAIVLGGGVGGAPTTTGSCTILTGSSIVCSSASSGLPSHMFTNTTSDALSSFITAQKSRSGGDVQAGDFIFGFLGQAFANTAFRNAAQFNSRVDAAPSGSNIPTRWEFITSNAAGLANQTLFFNSAAHLAITQATAPAASSCGTTPAITAGSTDMGGTVTMGTGSPTGCVITFGTAFAVAPKCAVTWQANLASMQYTISTTAITLVQTGTSSNLVNWTCGPAGI